MTSGYGYPDTYKRSPLKRVLRSKILAILFIVVAVALLIAGIWWDNQRTDEVSQRLREAASTSAPAAPLSPTTTPAETAIHSDAPAGVGG